MVTSGAGKRNDSDCGSGAIRNRNGNGQATRLSAADGAQIGRKQRGVCPTPHRVFCAKGSERSERAFQSVAVSGFLLDFRAVVQRRHGRKGPKRKDCRVRNGSSFAPGTGVGMQSIKACAGNNEVLWPLQEQDHQDDGQQAKAGKKMHH